MADLCCHDASLALNEPIGGTAKPDGERWIVLQYQGVWSSRAYASAELPTAVRDHIDAAVAALPGTRVQLIRRARHDPTFGLALYLARSAERELLAYRLPGYAAIVDLDLVGLLSGAVAGAPVRSRPLYLVCTHGRRDACCAKWGIPVYEALSEALGDDVWQADHLGGHRLAANVISLPDGLAFGRLSPETVPDFVAAMAGGMIPGLAHYRGRSAYPQNLQAAEWHLLDALGRRDPLSFRVVDSLAADRDLTATFEDMTTGERHVVEVVETPLPRNLVMSCGDEPKAASTYCRKGRGNG